MMKTGHELLRAHAPCFSSVSWEDAGTLLGLPPADQTYFTLHIHLCAAGCIFLIVAGGLQVEWTSVSPRRREPESV